MFINYCPFLCTLHFDLSSHIHLLHVFVFAQLLYLSFPVFKRLGVLPVPTMSLFVSEFVFHFPYLHVRLHHFRKKCSWCRCCARCRWSTGWCRRLLCVCLYLSSICICMCVCIILGRSTPGADVVLGADGQQADASAYFVFFCICPVFVFACVRLHHFRKTYSWWDGQQADAGGTCGKVRRALGWSTVTLSPLSSFWLPSSPSFIRDPDHQSTFLDYPDSF